MQKDTVSVHCYFTFSRELELIVLARPADQLALGPSGLCLPNPGFTGAHHCAQFLCRGLNEGPSAYKAGPLLTEPLALP